MMNDILAAQMYMTIEAIAADEAGGEVAVINLMGFLAGYASINENFAPILANYGILESDGNVHDLWREIGLAVCQNFLKGRTEL